MDLSGKWKVVLDPSNVGESENWQRGQLPQSTGIELPGSLCKAGLGEVPGLDTEWTGSIYDRSWFHDPELEPFRESEPPHFPFWLTPLRRYVGVAWYEREIEVSEAQIGKPIRISLERPHWQTKLWIDGQSVGKCNSLCVHHEYEYSGFDRAGTHVLTLQIDNAIREINPGMDSHSISDHTQGNWNGVIGKMELTFLPEVEIESVRLVPDFEKDTLKVSGLLRGCGAIRGNLWVGVFSKEDGPIVHTECCVATQSIYHEFEVELSLNDVERWDEFNPALYTVHIRFRASDGVETVWEESHGFRELTTQGTHFFLNGRKLFLRGNVDCCIFPKTGYPPMDIASWITYFETVQQNGFNHVRFHSWCPSKAAFEAADQRGVYLQVEAPTWPNHGVSVGEGKPVDAYIYKETERILDAYGNHASLCFVASGNEPFGDKQVEYLSEYVRHFRKLDPRQLYTGASVGTKWPFVRESDFIVHSQPRGLPFEDQAPHACFDFEAEIEGFDQPFVSHEMGQFCVFPDFSEISKYKGVLRARNLEMFQQRFLNSFAKGKANEFLEASGKLQLLCYKAEIEAALRTEELAGIQLLGANDFPGQGTALIGWLNAFYENKPYVDPNYLKRFLAPTVLLARTGKFVYRNVEVVEWILEVAHFGPSDLENQELRWQLFESENGASIEAGSLPFGKIATGKVTVLTMVNIALDEVAAPSKCVFRVELGGVSNEWNIWVYPEVQDTVETPDNLLIAESWSDDVKLAIESGKDVLLAAGRQIENGKDVAQYFRPAFWNTSWFQMAPPHTLGLSIDSAHPIFGSFPTDSHSDFHWWELVQQQPVVNLEHFPKGFEPIVQPIDTWFINRRLGLLFEFRIGDSRIVFCASDLTSDPAFPVRTQLRQSILQYMNGNQFDPKFRIEMEMLTELFEEKERKSYDVMTDEKPDELIPGSL